MRVWRFYLLAILAVATGVATLPGCAAPYVNQHIEAVNAEYRALNAYSYELERENSQLCDEIESLKDEITRLKGGTPAPRRTGPFSAPGNRTTPSYPRSTPGTSPAVDPDAPMIEVPDAGTPAPMPAPTLPPVPRTAPPPAAPPRVGPLVPRSPVSTQKPADKPAENSLQLLPSAPKAPRPILEDPPPEPSINNLPAGELPPPLNAPEGVRPEPVDGRVTHLFLNPLLTRGVNLDSTPGDDGLSLVLEPRNQAGEFVPHAATMTIVVLDPTKSGDAARVARWNLDEKLVRQRINRTSTGRGIHLQLPWAGGPPATSQVKLYVQYTTSDGRKVEAQHDVMLNNTATASQRWTPRPGDRPRTTIPTAPLANNPANNATPPSIADANPPLPAPAVQSDLTKVAPQSSATTTPIAEPSQQRIQEPAATQTDIAKQPAGASSSPALLQPPPKRPEWQPFR